MGFTETIAETARRKATGDDWYVQNLPYVLEIQASGVAIAELGLPFIYIQLPLAPENYRVSRIMRQSVTPTIGGLIAEERGWLWNEIEVRGTFGLQAKASLDISLKPEPPPLGGVALLAGAGLSGPGWTRRLVRNYFEKYAEMKANPLYASQILMIWHDFKTDDHWIVVPETIEIARTPQRRFQYPFDMRFKAIDKAENFASFIGLPLSNLSGFGKIASLISSVNSGLALANSAVQEGSEVLGEARYYAAGIDSVLSKVTDITRSADDFVNGATETISIGRLFINSAAAQLQEQLALIEDIEGLPDAVRQNYQMALDGLDAIASQRAAFGTTYDSATNTINTSEKGAARTSAADRDAAEAAGPPLSAAALDYATVRSTDNALIDAGAVAKGRTFGDYTSFKSYSITSVDTLQGIAARFLKDGGRWYDIAIINGLQAPYISDTGAPGTVGVGDVISIPVVGGNAQNAIVSGEGDDPGSDLLGTDLGLVQDPNSIPGRPLVDLAIDKRTYRDCLSIEGVPNLVQALQLRSWTEQGSMPLAPGYGLPRAIGVNMQGPARTKLYELAVRRSILDDTRVSSIGAVRLTIENDVIDADMDIIPIGFDTAQAVSTALV